jgi:hypothetical protein
MRKRKYFNVHYDVQIRPYAMWTAGFPSVGKWLASRFSHFTLYILEWRVDVFQTMSERSCKGRTPSLLTIKPQSIFSSTFLPFGSLLPLLEHRADFSVSWSFTDGRTLWTGDQLVARPLPNHRTTQTQKNAHTHQTSMPWVGFETTIPASERAKTVQALERSATVTGKNPSPYCCKKVIIWH